jgi:hypothetical protein
MINAREELLVNLDGELPLCAEVFYDKVGYYSDNPTQEFTLKIGYSRVEFDAFMESLNFEYDNGYGSQELSGTVWLKDGRWFERGEYDGSEWWELKECPEIPDYLKEK